MRISKIPRGMFSGPSSDGNPFSPGSWLWGYETQCTQRSGLSPLSWALRHLQTQDSLLEAGQRQGPSA